jgi:hypothetical protein
VSVVPPTACGITILIGFDGKGCAEAAIGAAATGR